MATWVFQWRMAKIQHAVRQAMGEYQLEKVVEPPESFRYRPTHCINPRCGIRLNMPGTIGTCSSVCRDAVDGALMDQAMRNGAPHR